jgi:nitronate monooxygenase
MVQDLLDLLGIKVPIIQAPMAGVSTPEMAAAASNAGALGSIAIGAVGPGEAANMIGAVRAATSAPFNVNLFCHAPARPKPEVERAWIERLRPEYSALGTRPPDHLREIYRSFVGDEAMLGTLLDARPPIVSFHFGLPGENAIRSMRAAGIVMLATATEIREARAIEAAGLDAIVAQGWEAGGHRGCFDPELSDEQLSTSDLVSMLSKASSLPVIAAGGIMCGRDIAIMLELGAAACQLGTAFVGSDESIADKGHRAALFDAAARGTVMTRAISGRPARCLSNRFTALGDGTDHSEIPDYPIAYDLAKSLHAAGKARGEYGFGAQWAGEAAAFARAGSTKDIIAWLVEEYRESEVAASN